MTACLHQAIIRHRVNPYTVQAPSFSENTRALRVSGLPLLGFLHLSGPLRRS